MAYATTTQTRADVEQCVKHCEQAFGNLRAAADQVQAGPAKSALQQASQALQQCINNCRSALQQM